MKLFNQYIQFEYLIKNNLKSITLPEYKLWNHKISLQKGKSPIYKSIYTLNQTEIKKLRKYIKINQKKGFIKLSSSPTDYLILFILKKDKILQLYVNYH